LAFGSPAAFSPTSFKANTPTGGSDYSSRKNKGQVVVSGLLNFGIELSPATVIETVKMINVKMLVSDSL
jgi:hypothetical protein